MAASAEALLLLDLEARVENGKSYTLEELSRQTGATQGQVHRALMCLSRREGWGLRPDNTRPYGRMYVDGRIVRTNGRSRKGEPYVHDKNEPRWEPTKYIVTRPS